MDIQTALAVVATILTALGAILPWLTRTWRGAVQEKVERDHLASRMAELDDAIRRQESSLRRAQLSDIALTVGQFIIGGVLASSFVQTTLPSLVGFLGLLVLASSLVRQQFRPERESRLTLERLALLKKMRRKAQDLTAEVDAGANDAPSRNEIAKLVSNGLNEVDDLAISQIRARDSDTTASPKPAGPR